MDAGKRNTIFLGLAFVLFLALSYIENMYFFTILSDVLRNHLLAVGMLFIHNILAISLILLGMTFYVDLVLNFFIKGKYERVVIEHPRTFAVVFATMILFLSILRTSNLLNHSVPVEALPVILLVSAPIAIVEGYGIYLTIKKTLSRTISMKDLVYIYGIFLIAAIMEVGFISLLTWIAIG